MLCYNVILCVILSDEKFTLEFSYIGKYFNVVRNMYLYVEPLISDSGYNSECLKELRSLTAGLMTCIGHVL